jgi:parallel beta-helix repeat protein
MTIGDVGAIYYGRDWTYLDNVFRYNYLHDIQGVGDGAAGIYLDDCAGGATIYGNVFRNVELGVLVGGGRNSTVENNIFVGCKLSVEIDGRGLVSEDKWRGMVYGPLKQRLEDMNYKQPPYSIRHPELQELDKYLAGTRGVPPEGNRFLRNICVGRWVKTRLAADPRIIEMTDNFTQGDPMFVDAANGDFRLNADSPALKLGFKPIPFDQIGLIKSNAAKP